MKYLIDTHVLLWAITSPHELSSKVVEILENQKNEIFVSSVSAWEVAIKFSLGKLSFENFNPELLSEYCKKLNFIIIPMNINEAISVMKLPEKENHKDPFDRLLISQAIENEFYFISKDSKLNQYKNDGLNLVW